MNYDSREGFIKDRFLKNAKSGIEALKCSLLQKTLEHEESPLSRVWLRVASPSVRPFMLACPYQMGGRLSSPATLHVNWRWISDSAAIIPGGSVGEGGGRSAPTPASTTYCSADTKAWMVASEIPKLASPYAGSGPVGYPLPPRLNHPPGPTPCLA